MSFRKVERTPKPRLPGDPPERPRVVPDSPSKPRKRLAPMSAKRKSEQSLRDAVVAATHERAGHRCEAIGLIPKHVCAFYPPKRPGLECHERVPRTGWPGGHLDMRNTISLCPLAHTWVDNHPKAAHELGLHGFSWERPDA